MRRCRCGNLYYPFDYRIVLNAGGADAALQSAAAAFFSLSPNGSDGSSYRALPIDMQVNSGIPKRLIK